MSTVSGPTPMSTTSTTTAPDKGSRMSSVVTETTSTRINGSNPPPEESLLSSAVDNHIANNTNLTAEVKDEPRTSTSPSDVPLPADLKRILAEVARTGSCSWLPWNAQQQQQQGPQPEGLSTEAPDSNTEVAAAVAAVGKAPPFALTQQNRRPYSNRLAIAQQPPRKKHRNGVKVRSHKQSSRKRPLFLIRTSSAQQQQQQGGSVGSSGRTSGSEPDDSTQYECDSEGTSATSCSELSTERNHLRNMQRIAIGVPKKPSAATSSSSSSQEHGSLKDVFRMALGLVLDHWHRQKGGYKLSPAERRRSEAADKATQALVNGESKQDNGNVNGAKNPPPEKSKEYIIKAEAIFQKRKERLLVMLGQQGDKASRRYASTARRYEAEDEGPPFTIQRIAEVLIAPERVSPMSGFEKCDLEKGTLP